MNAVARASRTDAPGERARLPLAAAALGELGYDGRARPSAARLTHGTDWVCIDDSACFVRLDRSPVQGRWVRVPGFFRLLDDQLKQTLPLVYQIADVIPGERGRSRLHTLCDPARQTWHPISLTVCRGPFIDDGALDVQAAAVERAISCGDREHAQALLAQAEPAASGHPRLLFARGALAFVQKDFIAAKHWFHCASLLAHPDGLEAEWIANGMLARNFRTRYPHIFRRIELHDFQGAISLLEPLRSEFPFEANAVMAYCARRLGLHREGLDASRIALGRDLQHGDLLGHLWSFQAALGQDAPALATARLHLQLFPSDLQAYTNALDAAVMRGDCVRARWYALGYLTRAVNLNTAMRHLFKYYDLCRDWAGMQRWYEVLTPFVRTPIAPVLIEQGETLTELGEFATARRMLDRAMRAAPQSVDAVLAYSRSLARSGDTSSAIRLISTVLYDQQRDDARGDRLLLTALLSELLRNNGAVAEALELWQQSGPIDARILQVAGARPLVEYVYCLASVRREAEATMLARHLGSVAGGEYVVHELKNKLRTIGMQV